MLNLGLDARVEDIKRSYRNMVRQWHPDQFNQAPQKQIEAEARIKEINVAYDYLCRHFSRKKLAIRNYGNETPDQPPITVTNVDSETFLLNLPADLCFPIIRQALVRLQVRHLAWNTYSHQFAGVYREVDAPPNSERNIEITVKEQGTHSRVSMSLAFTNYRQNVRIGFTKVPDLQEMVRSVLVALPFENARHYLKEEFYQTFQLHEVTFSEVRHKKILEKETEGEMFIAGISMNQALNLVLQAFASCRVTKVFWNTESGRMAGETGWSVRSCGQRVEAQLTGRANSFRLRVESTPMSYGGQTNSQLSDLGRGQKERNNILEAIRKRLSV